VYIQTGVHVQTGVHIQTGVYIQTGMDAARAGVQGVYGDPATSCPSGGSRSAGGDTEGGEGMSRSESLGALLWAAYEVPRVEQRACADVC
jgi:hypothetical protein